MADEEELAEKDSTNPHTTNLESEMIDQGEQMGTLSTPEIEIKSEVMEDEMAEDQIKKVSPDSEVMDDSLMAQESDSRKREEDISKPCVPGQLQSTCRPHSKDPRGCKKHLREMIGKHEIKNEELEKKEGDLRQRLEMLECSMPAVMVWNIWRMSQGAPASSIRRVLEKQLQGFASGALPCSSTPSQHYDCRVREVEAERKQAQRRADSARRLWAEKEFALEEQKKKLEEARKTQVLHKQRIEELTNQVQELRNARDEEKSRDGGSCQTGECGEIRCKQMCLGDVASTTSVKSSDLECLARLQELAEAELCMKRHITELECREETYMRTLQQADELWSKIESDTTSTRGVLQEQLDLKTVTNQQLADKVCSLEDTIEKMNTRLANCRNELGKFVGIKRADAIIGGDDDHADVSDQETLARVNTEDKDTVAEKVTIIETGTMDDRIEMLDKDTITEDEVPCADNVICGQSYYDSDLDSEGEPCGPNFVCNDVVFSLNGMEWLRILNEVQQRISVCSNCSPKKDDVANLLKSIRSYLQEGGETTTQKNIIATTKTQETENVKEREVEIKQEAVYSAPKSNAGQESDEEYQMAVEDSSENKMPSNERKESEKVQVLEAIAPSVIGKLSSITIVQDGGAVEARNKKEITEIDSTAQDQVEHDQEHLSHVIQQDFPVKDRRGKETPTDIGGEILSKGEEKIESKEKLSRNSHSQDFFVLGHERVKGNTNSSEKCMSKGRERRKDEESLTQNFHSQKPSVNIEEDKKPTDQGEETVLEAEYSGAAVKVNAKEKVNEYLRKEIISESKQLEAEMKKGEARSIRDAEQFSELEVREEFIDVIPEKEGKDRISIISEKDKLFGESGKILLAEELRGEAGTAQASPIEEAEEGMLMVECLEKLPAKGSGVLIAAEDAQHLSIKEMEGETAVMAGIEKPPAKDTKEGVTMAEGEPITPIEEGRAIKGVTEILAMKDLEEGVPIAEEEQSSPIEEEKAMMGGIRMLRTNEWEKGVPAVTEEQMSLMEEERAMVEDIGILPTEELKEEIPTTEEEKMLPMKEMKEDITREELEQDTVDTKLEKKIITTIRHATKVGKTTLGDIAPVLGEEELSDISAEEKKESEAALDCSCHPKIVPRERYPRKPVTEAKVDIRQEFTCSCKEKYVPEGETRSRPKLIIIRKTICRRPDELKIHLQRDETKSRIERTKLSYTRVKDESIGTVVSVGLQTQRKKKKEQSCSRKKFVDDSFRKTQESQTGGSHSTMNSSCVLTDALVQQSEELEKCKGPFDSESRCFMCEKELLSKTNVFVTNDSRTAPLQKIAHPESEHNATCFSCKQKQDSKSKVQSKYRIEAHENLKICPRPCSTVVVEAANISSHISFMKKVSRKKKDQSCLVKIVRSKVEYRERKQSSESELDVKNRKRALKNVLNPERDSLGFSQTQSMQTETSQLLTEPSSSCTCVTDESSFKNREISNNREKQIDGKENRSCHCDDSN